MRIRVIGDGLRGVELNRSSPELTFRVAEDVATFLPVLEFQINSGN
jgi:hypothetical protein